MTVTMVPDQEEQADRLSPEAGAEIDNRELVVASENRAAPAPAPTDHQAPAFARAGSGVIAEIYGVAEDLASARFGRADDTNDKLDALRSAIAVARERPREIDAMLALANQVDAIADLLASNEHMAAAIDSAVHTLRGDQNE